MEEGRPINAACIVTVQGVNFIVSNRVQYTPPEFASVAIGTNKVLVSMLDMKVY